MRYKIFCFVTRFCVPNWFLKLSLQKQLVGAIRKKKPPILGVDARISIALCYKRKLCVELEETLFSNSTRLTSGYTAGCATIKNDAVQGVRKFYMRKRYNFIVPLEENWTPLNSTEAYMCSNVLLEKYGNFYPRTSTFFSGIECHQSLLRTLCYEKIPQPPVVAFSEGVCERPGTFHLSMAIFHSICCSLHCIVGVLGQPYAILVL